MSFKTSSQYCVLAFILGEAIVSMFPAVCVAVSTFSTTSFALVMFAILCILSLKTKAANAAQDEGVRVLIVDDDAMNRKLITRLLLKANFQASAVSSGQECLDLVQKEHFDVIFMDLLMPEMDGVETLQRLRTLEGNLCKNAPVIALSANAFGNNREEYISRGFDDFLAKPIVADKLIALIRQKLLLNAQEVQETNTVDDEIMLPEIEGLDWDLALQGIKDKELLLRMLEMYYQSIPDECEAISNLAAMLGKTDEAINNYRIRVHSIKNTSAQLGIMSVSMLAKFLEYAARDGKIEKIRLRNSSLLDELIKMKERLDPVMKNEESESSKEMVSFSKISDSIDMLRFYISQMDIDNAFQIMDQIKSYAYAPELRECVDQLAKKVSALKFDDALKEIAELTEKFGETDENEVLFF